MIVQHRCPRSLDFSTFQSYPYSACRFLSPSTKEALPAAPVYLFTLSNGAHCGAHAISKSVAPFGAGQVFYL